jgi:hypothetical protein
MNKFIPKRFRSPDTPSKELDREAVLVKLPAKTAKSIITEAFNNIWLCRYLRPHMVHFDNGNKFKA